MKIAMVFDVLGIGGIERVGASYAELLVDAGHEVTVINLQPEKAEMVPRFPKACEYRTDRLSIPLQPDVFAALLKRRWGKYAYPLAYLVSRVLLEAKKLFSRLKNRDTFNVVIAFSGHVTDLTYVAYGLVKGEKKLAWAHGAIEEYLLLSYAFVFLYERIKNLCVLSTAGQKMALDFFPRLRDAVSVRQIYNPIAQAPTAFNPEKAEYIRGIYDKPIVMVGRFDFDKDQATVIRALKVLQDAYQLEPHLVFVGDGPTRATCEELAADLGVGKRVHFVGSQNDVDSYYLAASLAVHSSPAEGLPTVVLEAMRDDVAVLATNSLPGVPEILGDSEYGMVCKVGDSEDMAEKMYELLTNDELRQGFAEKGRQRVADFSPVSVARQVEGILSNLR